jgi:hypothetical protein
MNRAKKSYVPVNKWTQSGSTSIPHSFVRGPVIEGSSWENVTVYNYQDEADLSEVDGVLNCTYESGGSTVLNSDNSGIRKRIKNIYAKKVTEPVDERGQPERFCTCVDAMSAKGLWLLGDDSGCLTVYRDGNTIKRVKLPRYTSSVEYDDERMPGPISPPGYIELVKWCCDGLHAIVSTCNRVMLINLDTEEVIYSFETVEKNEEVGSHSSVVEGATFTPLGPVVHADPHPTDPLKALLSFYPPQNGTSNKYYTASPSSLAAHSAPDPHKLVSTAAAIYRHEPTNPDAIVLLSVYTSVDPDSSVNSMNPLQLKGKEFARISFLPSIGASTSTNPTDILQPQAKRR